VGLVRNRSSPKAYKTCQSSGLFTEFGSCGYASPTHSRQAGHLFKLVAGSIDFSGLMGHNPDKPTVVRASITECVLRINLADTCAAVEFQRAECIGQRASRRSSLKEAIILGKSHNCQSWCGFRNSSIVLAVGGTRVSQRIDYQSFSKTVELSSSSLNLGRRTG